MNLEIVEMLVNEIKQLVEEKVRLKEEAKAVRVTLARVIEDKDRQIASLQQLMKGE